MKKILMLGTGGTIASEITESGLSPQLTTEQILHYCPDISAFCRVDCRQLCNLDSTNIDPQHWQMMADAIREEYDRYDGFVLTHGTDTMAYTAAALCYLIQYSKKPIVLTGSQKPINLEITDSKTNLVDAFHSGYPCPQNPFQELSGVFQHQLPRACRHTGWAAAFLH